MQVYRHTSVKGAANINDIAEHRSVPRQVLEPTFNRLVSSGYATRAGDLFTLTPTGTTEISYARGVISKWIADTLAEQPEFETRPDRMQVQGALERVARGVLQERNETDDGPRPLKLGALSTLSSAPTTRFRAPAAPTWASAPTRPFRAPGPVHHRPPPGPPHR
jgi:hypothetical protein